MIGPFISGVYAGDPKKLGAKDAFNKMWTWEKEDGSMILGARKYMKVKRRERGEDRGKGLFSFEKGLGELTSRMITDLGPAVNTSEKTVALKKVTRGWHVDTEVAEYITGRVVIAAPPADAGQLFDRYYEPVSKLFKKIEMAPVAVVHLGVTDDQADIPEGFGFLAPRGEGVNLLGCVFISSLFKGRAPEGCRLLTAFVGGVFDPKAVDSSDEELVKSVLNDLELVFGTRLKPSYTKILRHKAAIPQLNIGHREIVQEIKQETSDLGALVLAGNYIEGVGVNDAVSSGMTAAFSIIKELGLEL